MKKTNLILLLSLFSMGILFSQTTITCDPAVKYPGGRMAISFDGNVHDDDDIIALPVSMGIIWAAGLKDKVAHVEYNNHVCSHGPEDDGTTNFKGDDAKHMQVSANESIKKFGFDSTKFFDFSTKGTEATTNFIAAINASSATDPLWIIAAGPMETVWRALNGSQTNKRQYVTVISHSRWNQNHGDCGTNSHTWSNLVQDFTGNGVKFVESCGYNSNSPCTNQQLSSSGFLADQNISNGDNDFSTPIDKWYWLRDNSDPNLSWIFTRNPFGNKFDPSDAGIVYFLISGGPNNGGAKKAGWKEVKTLLENPCKSNSVEVDLFIKAFPNPTTGILTLPEVFTNDQISVVSVQTGTTVLTKKITQNGSTQLDITNQPAGNYIIRILRNNQILTRQIIKS